MIDFKYGTVIDVVSSSSVKSELYVDVSGTIEKAVNYTKLTGEVKKGDKVFLNITAVSKKLGTGGYHFVASVEGQENRCQNDNGHIMKMRYTPMQIKVLAVEEKEHPENHLNITNSLKGMPVIVGSLHSMIAPAAAALKYLAGLKIFYLMTDGAALPLWFSRLAEELKKKGIIDKTITCGHAFGGDYEAVNIYSGMLFAQSAGAEVVIAAMGPGIVGTSSQFGHTGIEQGEIINAVKVLGGRAIAIPRISFADSRERHYGLSHHTFTSLGKVALASCSIPIPLFSDHKKEKLKQQFKSSGIENYHHIVEVDTSLLPEILDYYRLTVNTMGRSFNKDPDFFHTAGAAGIYTSDLIKTVPDKLFNGNVSPVLAKKN